MGIKRRYEKPFVVIRNLNKQVNTTEDTPLYDCKSDSLVVHIRNGREVRQVPPSLVSKILIEYHDQSGHPGINNTKQTVSRLFFWPTMVTDIKEYVQSCHICQLTKPSNHSTFGELQPLPTHEMPLDLFSTDTVVIGSSAANTKAKYLQVTLDHHSRYVWLSATRNNTSDAIISSLDTVFNSVGVPSRLLTDNATNYRSTKLKRFLSRLGVKRSFSTPFHPQTNGSNEKVNDTIVKSLRREMLTNPSLKWSTLTKQVADNYNNSIHSSTGFTPSYLMYGIDRIGTTSPALSDARFEAKRRSDRLKALRKRVYDLSHNPLILSTGDLVRRRVPSNHPNLKKLSPRFEAPFVVMSSEGPVNAIIRRLKRLPNGSLEPIGDSIRVHISQIEPYYYRTASQDGGECGEPLHH